MTTYPTELDCARWELAALKEDGPDGLSGDDVARHLAAIDEARERVAALERAAGEAQSEGPRP